MVFLHFARGARSCLAFLNMHRLLLRKIVGNGGRFRINRNIQGRPTKVDFLEIAEQVRNALRVWLLLGERYEHWRLRGDVILASAKQLSG
jgi:hypothetical protein